MKKHFSSPKLLKFLWLRQSVIISFFLIVFFCGAGIYFFPIFFLFVLGVVLFDYAEDKNALTRFWVDEKGIHTKNLTLHWSDIESFELFEVSHPHSRGLFKKTEYPSMICLGEYNTLKSFRDQDLKKCIFISLIPQHLDLLERYGKGKSPAVDTILKYYSDIVKKP